ncbi:hypothetical protein [Streptomyces spinosisporus]|uniref:Integral membrane protein n=1 Tax=Streptomyces spinosisporus TaxID=2927582 RepID=A0ABS9XBZ6_9ACTN|nr:hypothetical protein [Streptomyces spinosisporus]MCI3239167.1 hypothetical protein [Streptomyces spinosisporus]
MDLQKPPAGPPEHPPARQAQPEGCLVVAIRLPVRIVVLVLVLPVRMVWDALVVAGRFLTDTVLRPVGRALQWIARAVFVWPFVGLWRYVVVPLGRALGLLGHVLVVVPLGWLYQWVLTPVGHGLVWLYARVLTPLGHAAMWVLRGIGKGFALLWTGLALLGAGLAFLATGAYAVVAWLARYLLVVPATWLYAQVLTPVGRAIAWCAKGLAHLVGLVATGIGIGLYWILRVLLVLPALALWRWVLVPVGHVLAVVGREVGQALAHAWRVAGRISLAVGRALGTLFRWIFVEPVRWCYRTVLTPVGHAVRDAVLRPAAEAARSVGRATRLALTSARESVRQARADFRRMLFGAPAPAGTPEPAPVDAGEPLPARTGEPLPVEAVDRREPVGPAARTLGRSTTALTKD